MHPVRVPVPKDQIAEVCRRYHVRKLAIFGSALREDFRPDSDVDVLVEFEPGPGISFDRHMEMLEVLSALFGREVDLVDKDALRNPFRRHSILTSQQVVYSDD